MKTITPPWIKVFLIKPNIFFRTWGSQFESIVSYVNMTKTYKDPNQLISWTGPCGSTGTWSSIFHWLQSAPSPLDATIFYKPDLYTLHTCLTFRVYYSLRFCRSIRRLGSWYTGNHKLSLNCKTERPKWTLITRLGVTWMSRTLIAVIFSRISRLHCLKVIPM